MGETARFVSATQHKSSRPLSTQVQPQLRGGQSLHRFRLPRKAIVSEEQSQKKLVRLVGEATERVVRTTLTMVYPSALQQLQAVGRLLRYAVHIAASMHPSTLLTNIRCHTKHRSLTLGVPGSGDGRCLV